MTKFIFVKDDQIKVNALVMNKRTISEFIRILFMKFPPPNTFTIKDIEIERKDNYYSDKSKRAVIFILEKMGYIFKTDSRQIIPYLYSFAYPNVSMILDNWAKMGNDNTKFLDINDNQ